MSYSEGRPDYSIRKEVPFEDGRSYGLKYYNSKGVLVGESTTHGTINQGQLEFDFGALNSDENVEAREKDPEAWIEREEAAE